MIEVRSNRIYKLQKMIKKLFSKDKKNAAELLQKLNISKQNAQYYTDYKQLDSLLQENNYQVLSFKHLLKEIKREAFNPSYLLKCAVLTHFFLQQKSHNNYFILLDFATQLMQKCNRMLHFIKSHYLTECTEQNEVKRGSSSTRTQQFWMGKSYFLLKQIIRPYLAYIIKFAQVIKQQQKVLYNQQQICQVWKHINLLNLMHGFTSNFTLIGRYYIQQYGGFIVLLSQALSVDINQAYITIQNYISAHQRLICVYSDKKDEKIEAEQFCRILEQIGNINEKFSQFYMGKYFYKYLQHMQQPKWIDINSKSFDRIFKATKRQKQTYPSLRKQKSSKRQLFKLNDMNVL